MELETNLSTMPSTYDLMNRVLTKIAWKQELIARQQVESTYKVRRGQKSTGLEKPIVFDETPEKALDSFAIEILKAYLKRDQTTIHAGSYIRMVIPNWMTWPMLNEWAQRHMVKYNFEKKQKEIQEKIDELKAKEAEIKKMLAD